MNDSGYVSLEVIAGFRKVKELSNKISSYHKKGEKEHNFMLYDINDALMNVVESWAMEQIYDFWNSMDEDDEEDDEI